jgi:type I restriction enzyme, S subunit
MERAKYLISEYDWLGEIPKDWVVAPLNSVTNPISIKDHPTEDLLSLYRDYGVILKNSRDDNHNRAGSDLSKYKLVNQGDLVINKMKAWQGSVGISKYRGIISPAYIICKVRDDIDSKFLNYLLRCNYYKHQYGRLSYGVRTDQWDIRYDDFKKLPVLLPEPEEQTQIAVFLDYKLSKIDRFIRKKKQLIKLLNEQKASIINQAVTKGLDSNSKMKPSGIEWVGDIPEQWEVKKLKYLASSVLGKMLCNEDKGGYSKKPYLKSKNIQWLNVDVTDVEEMWFSEKEIIQYRLQKGDLVLSEGGEVGKTCFWNDEIDECYIQNSAHKLTFNNESTAKFYLYLFFLYGTKGAFEAITNRVSIGHLTKDKLINLKCVYPNLSEQVEIVSHIETETVVINKIITSIEKEIALTQEYKTVLIAEAVTGKIDVRDFDFPKTLEDESYEDIEEELSLAAEGEAEYPNEDTEE